MGRSPSEMRAMTLCDYAWALQGWKQAHEIGKEDQDQMTPELFRAIMDAPVASRQVN